MTTRLRETALVERRGAGGRGDGHGERRRRAPGDRQDVADVQEETGRNLMLPFGTGRIDSRAVAR